MFLTREIKLYLWYTGLQGHPVIHCSGGVWFTTQTRVQHFSVDLMLVCERPLKFQCIFNSIKCMTFVFSQTPGFIAYLQLKRLPQHAQFQMLSFEENSCPLLVNNLSVRGDTPPFSMKVILLFVENQSFKHHLMCCSLWKWQNLFLLRHSELVSPQTSGCSDIIWIKLI